MYAYVSHECRYIRTYIAIVQNSYVFTHMPMLLLRDNIANAFYLLRVMNTYQPYLHRFWTPRIKNNGRQRK